MLATGERGLLAFEEPDFPEVGVQVPGGTVEPSEDVLAAAARELHGEAGLLVPSSFEHLLTLDIAAGEHGIREAHRRAWVRVRLPSGLPESWEHVERLPSGGGAPILFRFLWLPLEDARGRLDALTARGLDRL